MTQIASLSTNSVTIVKNFLYKVFEKRVFSDAHMELMVSLYATMDFADNRVVEILKVFQINLSEYITQEDIIKLQQEFPAVARFCYEKRGIDGLCAHHDIPQSLAELCMAIAKPKANKKVYLPYALDGQFALYVPNCICEGFEMKPSSWAMSKIIAIAYGIDLNIKPVDDLKQLSFNGKLYDYIFSFLPFISERKDRCIMDTIGNLVSESLNNNGEFYCILPMSFCSKYSKMFKQLLGSTYSALVIALPPIYVPISDISTCLFHLRKDGKGHIILMDATNNSFFTCQDEIGFNVYSLKVNSILETIQQGDKRYVWNGTVKDLTEDFNMTPSRYLINMNIPELKKIKDIRTIGELVEPITLKSSTSTNKECHLIGMKELSSNYLNCQVNLSDVPLRTFSGARRLSEDCLIAGFIGGNFKVGNIEGLRPNMDVAIRSELFAFKIKDERIVSSDFLLKSILSELSKKQAIMMATGTTITRLSLEDFYSIKVNIPSLEEQSQVYKLDTRASLTEADQKLLESYEEFRKDMHMKKHAIGQTILNFTTWWKILQRARKDAGGILDDKTIIGNIQQVSVSEIYDNMQNTVNQLQQQIYKLDRGNGLQTEDIALTEFIENYIEQHKSPIFRFEYDSMPHHAGRDLPEVGEVDFDGTNYKAKTTGDFNIRKGDPLEFAIFAPDALTIVFDNIVSNAVSHGFSEDNAVSNIIKITLKSEGSDYVITVANNGTPINHQLSSADVFTYGKTSKNGKNHFGIGGYEINKLMREFDGEAGLILSPKDEFPVAYELTFHNTNFIANF